MNRSTLLLTLMAGALCGGILTGAIYGAALLGFGGWILASCFLIGGGALLAMMLTHWRWLSITDDTTGIYNRRYLFRYLAAVLKRAERSGSPVALVVVDIDGFRKYNSRHGHLVGDVVLRSVAQALQAGIRWGDVIGRWGGEEFAMVLPNTNLADATVVAERARRLVTELSVAASGDLRVGVTISAGVAASPVHGRTMQELVHRADGAMYIAKNRTNLVLPAV